MHILYDCTCPSLRDKTGTDFTQHVTFKEILKILILTSTSFFFLLMLFFCSFSGGGAALLTGGLKTTFKKGDNQYV